MSTGWMTLVLSLAGVYNLAWSFWIALYPEQSWALAGLSLSPRHELWRLAGIFIGVLGTAVLVASLDPLRHWRIVLAALMAKLAGSLAFILLAVNGLAPWSLGLVVLVNDVVWWLPFGLILAAAYRRHWSRALS